MAVTTWCLLVPVRLTPTVPFGYSCIRLTKGVPVTLTKEALESQADIMLARVRNLSAEDRREAVRAGLVPADAFDQLDWQTTLEEAETLGLDTAVMRDLHQHNPAATDREILRLTATIARANA
jgi:hypothetical protein